MLGGICLLTVLATASFASPLPVKQKPVPKRVVVAQRYDVRKEVTLEGTIQSIVKKPTPGMMLGAHLIVSTSKGTIDAHIGNHVLGGAHALSLNVGQHVKIVGVQTTVHNKQVFLTRTIETGNRIVQVRTERGFLVIPGAKGKIAQTSANGGAR
jgi:hypothetical protein